MREGRGVAGRPVPTYYRASVSQCRLGPKEVDINEVVYISTIMGHPRSGPAIDGHNLNFEEGIILLPFLSVKM